MQKLVALFCLLALFGLSNADIQANKLFELLETKRSSNSHVTDKTTWSVLDEATDHEYSPFYIAPQDGLAELDKIVALPGQPAGVDFNQYSGYVTVDPNAGRALFYYFVESPTDSSNKPLVLWLEGGPGYSSMIGAMSKLGPFRITNDGKSIFRNDYAWNNVANMLFLESPAGVGFSYSNTFSDYDQSGDKNTANDAYIFIINWLERFPQYKTRDFYITGEGYAGHYVPQLAYTILLNNKKTNQTVINIKGIAIGNPWIDDDFNSKGMFDHWWTHALNSDATHAAILKYCDFANETLSEMCNESRGKAWHELGDIDISSMYAPICLKTDLRNASGTGSIDDFDPCWEYTLGAYLNDSVVQKALHAKPTSWHLLSDVITSSWNDWAFTTRPLIKYLIENDQRLWIFSGDTDGWIPITSSRYVIKTLNLSIETSWRPWYLNKEVGGYFEAYKGLLLITVRGAGNSVPSYQPQRALTMFSSFLGGILPPLS